MNKEGVITYYEPWQGIDDQGNGVTVNVTLSMSVEDCINLQRKISIDKNKPHITDKMTEKDFLDEFITIHWAVRSNNE